MADAAEIRMRIKSISETKKVTDAMYMISSVKMRKARREMENTMPYFVALREEIGELLHYLPENNTSRYFSIRDKEGINGRALLLITSDKGLSGSYNQTAIRAAEEQAEKYSDMTMFIIGEYGRQHFLPGSCRIAEDFYCAAGFPTLREAQHICVALLDYYNSNRVDEIDIIYTHFHAGRQGECRLRCLLPLDLSHFYDSGDKEMVYGKEYYPDPNTVLEGIVPGYLTGFIYSALVESYCSEQEARMSAMNSAGKNADEILQRLRLEYNTIRQAAITREMTELTSGMKALQRRRRKNAGADLQGTGKGP